MPVYYSDHNMTTGEAVGFFLVVGIAVLIVSVVVVMAIRERRRNRP